MSENYLLFKIMGDRDYIEDYGDIYFALNADHAKTIIEIAASDQSGFSYDVSRWPDVRSFCGKLSNDDENDWTKGEGFRIGRFSKDELDRLSFEIPEGTAPKARVILEKGGILRVFNEGLPMCPTTREFPARSIAASVLMSLQAEKPGLEPKSLWKKEDPGEAPLDIIRIEKKDEASLLAAFPKGVLERAALIRFNAKNAGLSPFADLDQFCEICECYVGSVNETIFGSMAKNQARAFLDTHQAEKAGAEHIELSLRQSHDLVIAAADCDVEGDPSPDILFCMPIEDALKKLEKAKPAAKAGPALQ